MSPAYSLLVFSVSYLFIYFAESCDFPPNLWGTKLKKEFEDLEYFSPGTVVKYECDRGFAHIPGTEDSVRCDDEKKWSKLEVFCKGKSFTITFDKLNNLWTP